MGIQFSQSLSQAIESWLHTQSDTYSRWIKGLKVKMKLSSHKRNTSMASWWERKDFLIKQDTRSTSQGTKHWHTRPRQN